MKYRIVNKHEKTEERAGFAISTPLWDLQEVVLPDAVLQQLEDVVCFMHESATLLDEWGFGRFMKSGKGLAVNFYGPPGTGKTITADALAKSLARKTIRVSYADLESKYLGETSKNLESAFIQATQNDLAEMTKGKLYDFAKHHRRSK